MVMDNIEFHAKWTQVGTSTGYTVSFVTNGGTAVTAMNNMIVLNSGPTSTQTGYEFVGWFINSDLSGSRIEFPYPITQDTVLYAKWTLIVPVLNFIKIHPICNRQKQYGLP